MAEEAPAQTTATVSCSCGKKAVWESDGIAANKVGYCRKHLPANVTREMLRAYAAR